MISCTNISYPLRLSLPAWVMQSVCTLCMRVAMLLESRRSNHTKPAFKKPSALLLFLLENYCKKLSLAVKVCVVPLCSLPLSRFYSKKAAGPSHSTNKTTLR